jgi:hypothetical protein
MANRWNAPVQMIVQVPVYDPAWPNNGHFGLYGDRGSLDRVRSRC